MSFNRFYPNPFGTGWQELRVSQRLIMNYFTAKRLLAALEMTVQRHEGAFGAVELRSPSRRAAGAVMARWGQHRSAVPEGRHW